ncbi:hypothetical protein ACIOD2_48265 [Amycolatopsis sp. NPDC088138]|uniref:hypothetical protein n=1 Tax=Amycolatopsis sp. NPDC088138 TaxID=3363938 RepID=UPI0037F51EE1
MSPCGMRPAAGPGARRADVAAGTLGAAPLHEPEVRRSIVLGTPRTGRVTAAVEAVAREPAHQVRQAVHSGRRPSARPNLPPVRH